MSGRCLSVSTVGKEVFPPKCVNHMVLNTLPPLERRYLDKYKNKAMYSPRL